MGPNLNERLSNYVLGWHHIDVLAMMWLRIGISKLETLMPFMMIIMLEFLLVFCWNGYLYIRMAGISIVNFGNLHSTAVMLLNYWQKYVEDKLCVIIICTSSILMHKYKWKVHMNTWTYGMTIISYYLGQFWNKLSEINRCEGQRK